MGGRAGGVEVLDDEQRGMVEVPPPPIGGEVVRTTLPAQVAVAVDRDLLRSAERAAPLSIDHEHVDPSAAGLFCDPADDVGLADPGLPDDDRHGDG